MSNPRPNPYVGPRSFRTGEKMYGRERETLELLDLIIAERIVLLYSPSGAGKTSLIQAALLPKLREEGFVVLPPLRVNSELPVIPPSPVVPAPPRSLPEARRTAPPSLPQAGRVPPSSPAVAANRYVLSTLLSLDETLPPEKRSSAGALAGMTFDTYLSQRSDLNDTSIVLLFDQFEEILTTDSMNLDAKVAFFEQVGEALRNRSRWALFSMREDYLAGLDPYVKPIPTRFATTYRLDLLGVNAAREAIQKPAQVGGVDFMDGAADKLINDLRQVQVQRPDGKMELQPGPYVEPVQLQVVCYRLWDKIPETKNQIVENDIAEVGDVNSALSSYYDLRVLAVAGATGEPERRIREWFEHQLITEGGIRGQVMMEPDRSRGLDNRAIRLFEDAHLVRADERRGATWFELAHDRLIEPVRRSNALWLAENLSQFQQDAVEWERRGRPDAMLLSGTQLENAEKEAAVRAQDLTGTERAFLDESLQARRVRQKEVRQNRRIRYLAIGATALSVVALIGICAALLSLFQLGQSLQETDAARAQAIANEQLANEQKAQVVKQDRVAKMTAGALSQLDVDPEVSLLLATEAYSLTQDIETDDALRQAVNASRVRGTLRGHTSSVDTVTISPDGKTFATGSGDSTIKLWDAANGKELRTLQGHTAPIWSLAFNSDGSKLASASEDGSARIWDLKQCTAAECPFMELAGHQGKVWSVAFTPDNAYAATGSDDNTIQLWKVEDGSGAGILSGHTGSVNAVAFSPDGQFLLSASSDQTARLWDLTRCTETTCPFREIKGPATFWSAAFSPDGTSFVLGSDDQIAYKYDSGTLSITNYLSGHNDAVFSVAYSPDGKYIATGSRDGTARIWDANTGQLIAPLRGHESTVWSVTFSPDSKLLLTGSDDQTAKLWTVTNGSELQVLRGHTNKVLGADYSGDGKRVISVSQDRTARVWDAATGDLVVPPLVGHTNWILGGALNGDGSRAATASFDQTVRVWDLTRCDTNCASIEIPQDAEVYDVTFSPDGAFVLVSLANGTAQVWNAATGDRKMILTGHQASVLHSSYSRDGKFILTASEDGTARVWDAATGKVLVIIEVPGGTVQNAHFNPDATLVVTAGTDRTTRVWDIAAALNSGAKNARQKFELRGHTGPVTDAVFSNDGKRIATGSADKTIRLWDISTALNTGAATQQELAVLRGHTDKVQTVEFSPDDTYMLTASSDRTARITLLNIKEILDLARQYATRALSCDEWQTILAEANYCPGGGITQTAKELPTLAPITRVAIAATPDLGAQATAAALSAGATEPPPITPQRTPTAEPTLAEPTSEPTTATESGTPTEAVQPTALAIPTSVPVAATPTPALAPGVYVSQIVFVPIDAQNFQFKVNFVNTTGAPFNSKWLVPFFEAGVKNSIGAPKGQSAGIPEGQSEFLTEAWKVGVGQCTNYTAKPVSQDGDGRQTPILQTNGQETALEFQLCP